MLLKLKEKCKKIRSSHILALCFLLYVFYTGLAPLPLLFENTAAFLKGGQSVSDFLYTVDEQYSGMLDTEKHIPPLQNKATYINFNSAIASLLNQEYVNEIVRLNNGHLTLMEDTPLRQSTLERLSGNIERLYLRQKEQGKHFLFILTPSQLCRYENLLPPGYEDFTDKNADALLSLLEEKDIPYYDLRTWLHESGMTHEEAFFVTDHHWTPQTGFAAYGAIMEKLEQTGAIGAVDPFYTNPDNFTFTVYEDCFLGSSGRRLGPSFAGVDDFCMITPNFDTDISVVVESRGIDARGRFEEVVNSPMPEYYYLDPDYFNSSPYSLYGGDDRPHIQRRNPAAPDDTRMLFIGDSFGNIPFAFMSLYFSTCDELDMRYYTDDFTGYYEAYDPDVILLMVNTHDLHAQNIGFPYFRQEEES